MKNMVISNSTQIVETGVISYLALLNCVTRGIEMTPLSLFPWKTPTWSYCRNYKNHLPCDCTQN